MSNTQSQKIDSNDLNLADIFKDFYIVPSFQREYVWEDEQVEQLLYDVLNEFPDDAKQPVAEYFIGSIVVCPGQDGTFELIDGQQRMTTSFILFCAVRDYLSKIQGKILSTIHKQIADVSTTENGDEIHRYRVELQYEDSHGVLEQIAEGNLAATTALPQTHSVANMCAAHQTILNFLQNEFGDNEAEVRRFYAYFINRVKLIRIDTGSIAHALKVFETVNDRGVGLDSMDLLKNLMFMRASQTQYETLKERWKLLVDTLYQAKEKPLRFLRYFIFSRYDVERLKEDEIYRWFADNEDLCGYGTEPLGFVNKLCDAATAYVRFVAGQNSDGTPNRYLTNIRYLSGAARQHNILLLAGQRLEPNAFTELCRQLENLFFAYIITREPTKEFERSFARWAPNLRPVQTLSDLSGFLDAYIAPAKSRLANRYELAFMELRESRIQKYRMRYIIGKLTQYVNERAYGATEIDLVQFIQARDVEHILPQTPTTEIVDSFDKPDEINDYIEQLGNLTLLEYSINRHIGNDPFDKKREAYKKTHFLLTRTIAEDVTLGNTNLTKAVEGLEQFDIWNSDSIELRQLMLTEMARKVWEMPDPSRG